MNNNDMNIELLKAMRGVWILQIQEFHKHLTDPHCNTHERCSIEGKILAVEQCLTDLISIIGE